MEKKSSYFKKHWRGELDLAISYWVNNVFFSLLILLATLILEIVTSKMTNITFILIILILFYSFIFFIYAPWAYIGLWRSSSNHIKKNGRFFWANVVRIIIIIGVFRTVMAFVDNAYPQMVGFFKILTGTDEIPNYTISVENSDTTLKIVGGIKFGLTKDVTSYIKKYPNIKRIQLDSMGGRIREARGVAKIVEENGLDTYVFGICVSSCTYIFVSGKERVVSTYAKFGFHRPAFAGVDERAIDTLIVEDKKLFKKQGVDSAFIKRVFSTPNSQILEVSPQELKEVGVATKIVNVSNNFWEKSEKELEFLLESSGLKKNILEKNNKSLMDIAFTNMKASLPSKVDEITILNSVVVKEKSLKYKYSILRDNNINDLKEFQKTMQSLLQTRTCNDLFSVYLLKRGVVISHSYIDNIDKSLLADVEIRDCSGNN